jgi:hypothetical protein
MILKLSSRQKAPQQKKIKMKRKREKRTRQNNGHIG